MGFPPWPRCVDADRLKLMQARQHAGRACVQPTDNRAKRRTPGERGEAGVDFVQLMIGLRKPQAANDRQLVGDPGL